MHEKWQEGEDTRIMERNRNTARSDADQPPRYALETAKYARDPEHRRRVRRGGHEMKVAVIFDRLRVHRVRPTHQTTRTSAFIIFNVCLIVANPGSQTRFT